MQFSTNQFLRIRFLRNQIYYQKDKAC